MSGDLGATNLLLGIMAVVSVLEALAVIGLGVAGFAAYRRVMDVVNGLESRQVAPAMARLTAILESAQKSETKPYASTMPSIGRSIGWTTPPSACGRTFARKRAG